MADGKKDEGSDFALGFFFLIVFLAVLSYFLYSVYTAEIHGFIRWIRYGEMWLISLVTNDDYMVSIYSGEQMNLKDWLENTKKIPKEQISLPILGAMSAVALYPLKWVIMAIIMAIGLWTYNKGPGTQYTAIFNLDSFLKFQSGAFPIISPFVDFNPCNQPPRAPGSPVPAELPSFAEALGPEEWLAYYQVPIVDGKLDQKATFSAFSKQLGPRWRGYKHLKPYQQILLAACCYKASRSRDKSDEIMGRLALCWSHSKGLKLGTDPTLLREARAVLKNRKLSETVLKACNRHAWETTAMLRALFTAREEGGVLAPAQFVWLRAHNRELWYPLNNLGRQSCHMEAIGAMAHFRAEKRADRPIPKAKVQGAVDSIVEYMDSNNARPIPQLDYSASSNKKGIKKVKTT